MPLEVRAHDAALPLHLADIVELCVILALPLFAVSDTLLPARGYNFGPLHAFIVAVIDSRPMAVDLFLAHDAVRALRVPSTDRFVHRFRKADPQ